MAKAAPKTAPKKSTKPAPKTTGVETILNNRRMVRKYSTADSLKESQTAFEEAFGVSEDAAPTDLAQADELVNYNDRLTPQGMPIPRFVIRNRQEKGYHSPRQEYIESLQPISIPDVAASWNLDIRKIMVWSKNQNWPKQRDAYWADVNRLMWANSPEVLANLRAEALFRDLNSFKAFQAAGMAMLESGQKPRPNPITGQIEYVDLEPGDLLKLSKANEINVKGELVCLGLNFATFKEGMKVGETDEEGVTGMVFNVPLSEDEMERFRSANGELNLALTEGVIEGELIED